MAKEKVKASTSIKSYRGDINLEKQKMGAYAKKMRTSVKSLQGEFKKHGKEMKEAGRTMIAEGNKNMNAKVGKFKGEIKDQIKINEAAAAHLGNGVKFLLSEINQKKKDFRAYTRGPFNGYIRAFWG